MQVRSETFGEISNMFFLPEVVAVCAVEFYYSIQRWEQILIEIWEPPDSCAVPSRPRRECIFPRIMAKIAGSCNYSCLFLDSWGSLLGATSTCRRRFLPVYCHVVMSPILMCVGRQFLKALLWSWWMTTNAKPAMIASPTHILCRFRIAMAADT